MADAKTNFTLCCRKKSFGIGADGNVACITQWESQSDSYTGISTRFTSSPKTLHHFYLMLKCCLFQYVFFLWRVDYALEGSMFWLSNCKCDFSRLLYTEVMTRILIFCGYCFWSAWFALWCKSNFFNLFRSVKLFIVAQLGFWVLYFCLKCLRIWTTKRFSSTLWMWCFPAMLYHAGPSSLVLFVFLWPLLKRKALCCG